MAFKRMRARAVLLGALVAAPTGCDGGRDAPPASVANPASQNAPGSGPAALSDSATLREPSPVLTLSSATEAGMSAAVLDSAVALYREAVSRDEIVGAVLLVARHGKIVMYEAMGSRNREARLPMEKGSMFRMSSNTKPVIAAGVAILAEQGRLRYTDSVKSYIPAFDNRRARPITVHQLLSHTSGLRIDALFSGNAVTMSRVESWLRRDPPSLRREVDLIGAVGPAVPPGTSYDYSNPGYNTLGALIEVVSGRPLGVFLRDEIYRKLGMVDTYNQERAENLEGKLHRMGPVYYEREGKRAVLWKPGDPPEVPFVHASGGLVTTAWDYAVFMQMLLNGGSYGDTRLLSPQTVKLIFTNHGPPGSRGYGYGWGINDDGTVTHSGSNGTYAWANPKRGILVVALTQTHSATDLRAPFVEIVSRAVEGSTLP